MKRRRSGGGLLWAGFFFLVLQGALAAALESCLFLRDPEDGFRLALLLRFCSETPDFSLALGTSRTANGLCTDAPAAPGLPTLFNYGITGSDLPEQAMRLRRLLGCGVRPRRLFVEILPAHLTRPTGNVVEKAERLTGAELRGLSRFGFSRERASANWLASRAAPWSAFRAVPLSRWLPWLLPAGQRVCAAWEGVSVRGWRAYGRERASDEGYARGLQAARDRFGPALESFRIEPGPDRALRDVLALCRRERIPVTLYLMPEASAFRGWYAPQARDRLDDYLKGLNQEFGVRLIDARDWLPDEAFADGHHLLPRGARAFTARFALASQ